jgi:hypothetical protein
VNLFWAFSEPWGGHHRHHHRDPDTHHLLYYDLDAKKTGKTFWILKGLIEWHRFSLVPKQFHDFEGYLSIPA